MGIQSWGMKGGTRGTSAVAEGWPLVLALGGHVEAERLLGAELDALGLSLVEAKVTHDHRLGALVEGNGSEGAGLQAPTATGAARLLQPDGLGGFVQTEGIPGAGLDAGGVPAEAAGDDIEQSWRRVEHSNP